MRPSWYENILLNSDDSVWILHLRLPRGKIDNLCQLVKEDMAPADLTVRDPIPLLKR